MRIAKWLQAALLTLILMVGDGYAQKPPIVISAADLTPEEIAVTVPMIGLEPIPEELLAVNLYAVPADYITQVASQYPEAIRTLIADGVDPKAATPLQWVAAARKISHGLDMKSPKFLKMKTLDGGFAEVNGNFIIGLLGTELIVSEPEIRNSLIGANIVPIVPFDASASRIFYTSYSLLNKLNTASMLDVSKSQLGTLQQLAQVTAKILTNITFGRPIIYSTAERGFQVSEDVRRLFDVYWVEFAISLRPPVSELFAEINYTLQLPAGAFAHELIPLRFDRSVQEIVKRGGQFSVGDPRIVLSVGASLERQVMFERLNPLVAAIGLQEQNFGWSFQEEAITPGTHRLVAILAVPKGLNSITVGMQADARAKRPSSVHAQRASTLVSNIGVRLRP